MASLRFKNDGTPFVDFRVQGKRFRPEFFSATDAQKFVTLANANPVAAYEFWQECLNQTSAVVAAPEKISLKEKIDGFKRDYCSRRSNSTDMKRVMTKFFDFLCANATAKAQQKIDDLDIKAIDVEDFEEFQNQLTTSGLSNASVVRYMSTVKTFYKRAYKAQYIPVDYAGLVDNLSVTSVKRLPWRETDTTKLIAKLEERNADPVLTDVVQSMLWSPFGPIDFARLKWRILNFETGEINTFRMKGRGKRDWHVPMLFGYKQILFEIRGRHEAMGFGKPDDYVYLDRKFKSINPGWVSKSLERARKDAGIDRVPYSSRHRIISLVASKTDRDTASRFGGHASVKTTEKHYLVGGNNEFREKVKEAFAE